MTEDLDTGVGMLLKRLKALGLEENTYVIYTSDNGAVPVMPPRPKYKTATNHPLSRGKWDAMEGGIRVPFVIAGPLIRPGSESKTPITFSDLMPTVIDLADGSLPTYEALDGGSFKNILLLKGNNVKRSFDGLIFHVPYENGIALKRAHSSIVMDHFKLIKFYDTNELLLFDLQSDIEEKNNLALTHSKKCNFLEKSLDTYLHNVKAPKWKPSITWKSGNVEKINSFH
jgi:arylsulfatase A-like enzyme